MVERRGQYFKRLPIVGLAGEVPNFDGMTFIERFTLIDFQYVITAGFEDGQAETDRYPVVRQVVPFGDQNASVAVVSTCGKQQICANHVAIGVVVLHKLVRLPGCEDVPHYVHVVDQVFGGQRGEVARMGQKIGSSGRNMGSREANHLQVANITILQFQQTKF